LGDGSTVGVVAGAGEILVESIPQIGRDIMLQPFGGFMQVVERQLEMLVEIGLPEPM